MATAEERKESEQVEISDVGSSPDQIRQIHLARGWGFGERQDRSKVGRDQAAPGS
jgi:hypothetical protein